MKDLLISDIKKIGILKALSDEKVHTYYHLSQVVGTNYETIRKNCRFLELLELVRIDRITREESASNRAHYAVKITDAGLGWIKNISHKWGVLD